MRLAELKPRFLKHQDPTSWKQVETIEEADGICFLCPKCFAANGGPVGTHSIICWSPGVPQDTDPKPGRWSMHGTGFDDLSLRAGSSSVLLNGGCRAHFFVENGQIRDA